MKNPILAALTLTATLVLAQEVPVDAPANAPANAPSREAVRPNNSGGVIAPASIAAPKTEGKTEVPLLPTFPTTTIAAPKTEGKTEGVGEKSSANKRISLRPNAPVSYTRTVSSAAPRTASVSRVNLRRPTSASSISAPLSGVNTQQQAPAAGGATAQ